MQARAGRAQLIRGGARLEPGPMCGIGGFWCQEGLDAEAGASLRRMTDAIAHRGPDDSGHFLDGAAGVALGHRRLAILDLSAEGHQPMASPSGRFVVTYNGEIYNFVELREELAARGRRFRGGSDTEVLLAAVEEWGVRAGVQRCAGMFAFGAWGRGR